MSLTDGRRWHRPDTVLGVQPDTRTIIQYLPRRGWLAAPKWLLDPDGLMMVREGRKCVQCMEDHEVPYPDQCQVCGFPMRAFQARLYDILYRPEIVRLGPTWNLDDEVARLDHELAEDNYNEGYGPRGILVPRSAGGAP